MKDVVYYNFLFDCYGKLLTLREQEYFKAYYNEDLSYGEIAINDNVSRSAVQKSIKNVLEKLDDYEQKLNIFKNKTKLANTLEEEDIIKIKKVIKSLVEE